MPEQNHFDEAGSEDRATEYKRLVDLIRLGLSKTIEACREIVACPEQVEAWLLVNQLPPEMLDHTRRIAGYDPSNLSASQQVEVLEMSVALGKFFDRSS